MKLIHYTNKEFNLEKKEYKQIDRYWQSKPHGLWVSVDGECDWSWWCRQEGYELQNLSTSYEVKLKKDAQILYLETEHDILNFANIYPHKNQLTESFDTYQIDWEKVKSRYQGIIITPYQWECRYHDDCCWYYSWDCASGCIWDLNCIEEFKLLEKEI